MLPNPFGGDDADGGANDEDEADYETARERLVERLRSRGYLEREATAEALRAVPRHEFVPAGRRGEAYADRPLPIGEDQTISAPHMVGMMTDLLAPDPGETILEVGTGCGYHAAVTSEAVGDGNVYSVEYVESLAADARERFERLGYDVHVRVGDGHEGWPEHAPYDGAYLTCAAEDIPPAVAEQVRPGGRVVAPLGTHSQRLVRAEVGEAGIENREDHGGVRFVSMQG
jgi:protein-L-isoaspartate(D-aspartate) O-methyltransferase